MIKMASGVDASNNTGRAPGSMHYSSADIHDSSARYFGFALATFFNRKVRSNPLSIHGRDGALRKLGAD